MTELLLCIHPVARWAALAAVAAGIVHVLLLARTRGRVHWYIPTTYLVIVAAVLWLGSFSISPLGFGRGNLPLIKTFQVTRPQRGTTLVTTGQTLLVAAGAPMEVEPVLLSVPVDCIWASSNGGAFEDPTQCVTAYQPAPGAAFDVIHVHIAPACGLPPQSAGMRISVLP